MASSESPTSLLHQTLADIVTADTRAAAVFDRLGLDYCCHGHNTLEDAAVERAVPVADVLADLEKLGSRTSDERGPAEWTDLGALAQHIVAKHHGYVRESTPTITAWLDKLVSRHGSRHAELKEVQVVFKELANELGTHMIKEESILFPFIESLAAAARAGDRLPAGPFGTILNPIRIMEEDHRQAGDHLATLRALTNGYQPPPDACTTYRLCYEELARYQGDLHRHVHLENNVLFPRAIALEDELA